MRLMILSPHRDDAAFSCGILLRLSADAEAKIQIVNVFTKSDYAPFANATTADHVSRVRKDEDALLQSMVGESLSFLDLDLSDAPLRLDIPAEKTLNLPLDSAAYAREVACLETQLSPHLEQFDCILLPLALGSHIDHQITRDAALRCGSQDKLAFYQDLPYAARLSGEELTWAMEATWPVAIGALRPLTLRTENGATIKRRFASCYRSQVDLSTVEEMARFAQARDGGETYYAGSSARRILKRIVSLAERSTVVR